MKKIISIVLAVALMLSFVVVSSARVSVRGYYRSNGTYVAPHYRTSPDSSFYNNWSTKGNYNPYTGRAGYKTYSYYYGR